MFVAISTIFLPSSVHKWTIFSPIVVPVMMNSGISAEFAQVIFRAGESVTYALTPAMAYFVIYLAFMEMYNQDRKDTGLFSSLKHMVPYSIATFVMWIIILVVWYLVGIPLGVGVSPVI